VKTVPAIQLEAGDGSRLSEPQIRGLNPLDIAGLLHMLDASFRLIQTSGCFAFFTRTNEAEGEVLLPFVRAFGEPGFLLPRHGGSFERTLHFQFHS
jgi:hypothetical protein